MSRNLTYEDRCAITEVIQELRGAEFSLILALRASFTSVTEGSVRVARADIANALEKLDAVQAMVTPPPSQPAQSDTVVPLVPRFEAAPAPTSGDAA